MGFIAQRIRRLLDILSSYVHEGMETRHLLLTCDELRLASNVSQRPSSPHRPLSPDRTIMNTLRLSSFIKHNPPTSFHFTKHLSPTILSRLNTISLDASSVHFIEEDALWPSLLHARNVQRLGLLLTHVSPKYFSIILDALRVPHASSSGEECHLLFPLLEALAVPFDSDEAQHTDLIASLIDLVHARQESGRPLLEVIVPKKVGHWSVWDTLRGMLTITLIDYYAIESPVTQETWNA